MERVILNKAMKKVILCFFALYPLISFGQCPRWIHGPADSALVLEKIAEKYLQVHLEKKVQKTRNVFSFENETCKCQFYYTTRMQKRDKKNGIKKHLAVDEIVINGPADHVKKMYTEYFYPLIKPCASSVKGTQMFYHNVSVGYFIITNRGSKMAQINLHKELSFK